MKKIILLILIFSTVTYSQIINDFGLKVGGTFSHQDWDYSKSGLDLNFDPDNRLGFNIGLFVESFDLSFFRIVGEVNFIQKGVEREDIIRTFENPEGEGTKLWEFNLNYLNLSLLLKPNMNFGIIKPYLLLGPKVDIELSKSVDSDESFFDEIEKSRIGLKLGLGSEIKILNLKLLAEFVYDTDLSNLYENENLEVTSNSYDFRIGVYF